MDRWREIDKLFHAALELEPSERDDFLDAVCAGFPDLRQEVESLLKSHYQDQSFLDKGAGALAADLIGDFTSENYVNKVLGHYHVLELIGAGGMGKVYQALDTRLQRKVALKVLAETLAPDSKLRFLREARAASALSHPNVATIYEIGESSGVPFISMELVDGETVAERIRRSNLSFEETVDFGLQLSDALQEAHAKGIIHRDIKPANLVITSRNQLKVLDFGLAKVREPVGLPEAAELTSPNMLLGTLDYMSPEQILGREVDARSDIFSTGVTLYRACTGSLPFAGETSTQIMDQILHASPFGVGGTCADLHPRLRGIIEKCLEKDPADRYQSAAELSQDLAKLKLSAEERELVKSSLEYRPKKNVRLGLAVAAVLVGVLLFLLLYSPDAPVANSPVRSLVVLPLKDLSGISNQEYFSDGMTEALINNLARIRALKIISRTSAMQYKDTDVPVAEIAEQLNVDAVLEGSVLRSGDRIRITAQLVHAQSDSHLWAKSYERDLQDVLSLQREVAQDIAYEIQLQLTADEKTVLSSRKTVDLAAYESYLRGRYYWNQRSHEGLMRAIEYFQMAIDQGPENALAYAGLADCFALLSPYSGLPARESYPRAKEAALKALEIDPSLGEAHATLALVQHEFEWDWKSAERSYRRAIELNQNYATAHQWYAEFLTRSGRHDDAILQIERAYQLDPLSLIVNSIKGWVLLYAGQPDASIQQLTRTLELDPDFVPAHNYLGLAYQAKNLHEKAIEQYRKAYELSGGSARYLSSLGVALALSGRQRETEEILKQINERSGKEYVPAFHKATLHLALGRQNEALDWLERAYEEKGVWMLFLRLDPIFELMNVNPRFQGLLERVGFTT